MRRRAPACAYRCAARLQHLLADADGPCSPHGESPEWMPLSSMSLHRLPAMITSCESHSASSVHFDGALKEVIDQDRPLLQPEYSTAWAMYCATSWLTSIRDHLSRGPQEHVPRPHEQWIADTLADDKCLLHTGCRAAEGLRNLEIFREVCRSACDPQQGRSTPAILPMMGTPAARSRCARFSGVTSRRTDSDHARSLRADCASPPATVVDCDGRSSSVSGSKSSRVAGVVVR